MQSLRDRRRDAVTTPAEWVAIAIMIIGALAMLGGVVIAGGQALRQWVPVHGAPKQRPAPAPVLWIETQEARR